MRSRRGRNKVATRVPGLLIRDYAGNYSQSHLGDIFEKAQSSKLNRLFSLKRGKRDIRALSFELSKMTPQVGLAVQQSCPNVLKLSAKNDTA